MTIDTERPFTAAIIDLHDQGYTYVDMTRRCDYARSTTWFNKLANSRSPWICNPPPASALPEIANMLFTTERRLAEMVAREWYGVDGMKLNPVANALAKLIDGMTTEEQQDVAVFVFQVAFGLSDGSDGQAA